MLYAVETTKLKEHALKCSFPAKAREETKFAACSSDVSNSLEMNPLPDFLAATDDAGNSLSESVMIFESTKIRSKGVER